MERDTISGSRVPMAEFECCGGDFDCCAVGCKFERGQVSVAFDLPMSMPGVVSYRVLGGLFPVGAGDGVVDADVVCAGVWGISHPSISKAKIMRSPLQIRLFGDFDNSTSPLKETYPLSERWHRQTPRLLQPKEL